MSHVGQERTYSLRRTIKRSRKLESWYGAKPCANSKISIYVSLTLIPAGNKASWAFGIIVPIHAFLSSTKWGGIIEIHLSKKTYQVYNYLSCALGKLKIPTKLFETYMLFLPKILHNYAFIFAAARSVELL